MSNTKALTKKFEDALSMLLGTFEEHGLNAEDFIPAQAKLLFEKSAT